MSRGSNAIEQLLLSKERHLNSSIGLLRSRSRRRRLAEIIDYRLISDYHGNTIEIGDKVLDLDRYANEADDQWLLVKELYLSEDEQPVLLLIAEDNSGQEQIYTPERDAIRGFRFSRVISQSALERRAELRQSR